MVDLAKYHEWYRTRGSRTGGPLDADSWAKTRRDLVFLEKSGLDLGMVTPVEASAWLVNKLDSGKVGTGRVNGIRTELVRWFRFRDGLAVVLPRWREPEPKEKALSSHQAFDALGFVHADRRIQMRVRFEVLFALTSGVEPSEAAMIDLTDFDLERGGVHVNQPCKGHRRRFVHLPKTVLTNPRRPSLATWLKYRETPKDDELAVFTGRRNRWGQVERLSPAALSADLQDVKKQTGVPINWQVTRHTWATKLLEAGFGERYLMKAGGWANLAHVARYAEARPEVVGRKYRSLKGLDPYQGGN